MKHLATLLIILTFSLRSAAQEAMPESQSDLCAETMMQELTPTYIPYYCSPGFRTGFFLSLQGGASAFIGDPMGCADLFGRLEPAFAVSLGKWFSPFWGSRIAVQGLNFKNGSLAETGYRMWHADLLLNTTGGIIPAGQNQSRWDLAPYIGLGLVENTDLSRHPFAFNYGLLVRYRLGKRIHVCFETGGMTTFRDFDGTGSQDRFGDNMLTASLGLSVSIGQAGWKRPIDAAPYMAQNEWLRTYGRQTGNDSTRISEINTTNDYSGLNSLRKRMKEMAEDRPETAMAEDTDQTSGRATKVATAECDSIYGEYLSAITNGLTHVGAPIHFFFQLGTDRLVDPSQHVNLDALAGAVLKNGLHVEVSGAADSATGTQAINDSLSVARAEYISSQLIERGVSESQIKMVFEGGTSRFPTKEANRYTKVELYF